MSATPIDNIDIQIFSGPLACQPWRRHPALLGRWPLWPARPELRRRRCFLGNEPNELPSTLPSDINIGAQVTDVVAGGSHTCALSSDGQLKCWGLGSSGQLGYGDFVNQLTPPAAGVDLERVTAYRISAGAAHTCALRSNGTARCWGQGADGRLGRGSTDSSATATGNVDIQILSPMGSRCPSSPNRRDYTLGVRSGPGPSNSINENQDQ